MSAVSLLIASGFALAAWLAPNHYPPWVAFHGELMMALALVVAVAGELAQRRARPEPWSPLICVTLLVACVPLLQAAGGLVRFAGDAWVVCAYLLGFAFAQWLGRRLANRCGPMQLAEGLALLFVAASLASVGLQLYQWLRLDGLGVLAVDMPPHGTPFANLAQPNHLASLLFLGLAGVLFLFERGRIRGWVATIAVLYLEAGMALTGSRTAWLAVFVLVVALVAARGRLGLRMTLPASLGIGAGLVAAVAMLGPANELLLLASGRSFATQMQAGPRTLFYATMLDAIRQQPWFGYGWNQGLAAQWQVLDAHPSGGRLMGNSHNMLLDLMVWNGIPLALALIAFMLWWLRQQLGACRDVAHGFMLIAILGVLAHAMVEYPLSYAYFLLPVGVMMGALDANLLQRRKVRLPRPFVLTASVATTALLAMIVVEYVEIESNVRTLRFETARIGTNRIESSAPDLLLLTQWQEYLRVVRVEAKPGMTSEEITSIQDVAERFPYSAALRQFALANALNGRSDVAALTLRRLCTLHSKRVCAMELHAWRKLASSEYPQLARVRLTEHP